jgi:hypothetical protein
LAFARWGFECRIFRTGHAVGGHDLAFDMADWLTIVFVLSISIVTAVQLRSMDT